MVTESIIPPAPAAHNTIAFINPDATYLSQHSGALVASSIPESSHNNKLWKTESRKIQNCQQQNKSARMSGEHTNIPE
jgi:hypothetical protein